jgi:hypothetical protein
MAKLANWRAPEGYITTTEAARRSGYTIEQIANLARSGRLTGRHVRNRWFVDGLALDAFLANRNSRPKRGEPQQT